MLPLSNYSLFFDFDGTLVDLVPDYKNIKIPSELPALLDLLYKKTNGALAIISGRSIQSLHKYISPDFPAAGLHGAEYWRNGVLSSPPITENFSLAKQYLKQHGEDKFKIEDKGLNIAIHHKNSRPEALELANYLIKKFNLNEYNIQLARNVVELKLKSFNKAHAIEHFMQQEHFKNRLPVAFGDDLTDETMFLACKNRNGLAFQIVTDSKVDFQYEWPKISSTAELRKYLQKLLKDS